MGAPKLSFIVLNWNKSALTLKCLKSVRRSIFRTSYEIVVVDNGSSPAELARLKEGLDENCALVSLDYNVFFGAGCNAGARAALGHFLLFLNNDVLLTSGSIDKLISHYESSFSPAAVGPTFLYPDGRLQEAGAFMLPNGGSFQQGKSGINPDRHFSEGVHIVDYCSAACLLVARDMFFEHGGFDPIFEPAYFEDVDLCFRMRANGFYTYYASDVSVYHEENVTSATLWSRQQIQAIVAANSKKFLERWSTYLKERLLEARQSSSQQGSAEMVINSDHVGNILLRSAVALEGAASSSAMLRCAAALEHRYQITLAAPEICGRPQLDALAHSIGVRLKQYNFITLSDTNESSFDHTISFPNDAFDANEPLADIRCLRALLDTL